MRNTLVEGQNSGLITSNKCFHKAMWYEKHAGGRTKQWGNNK